MSPEWIDRAIESLCIKHNLRKLTYEWSAKDGVTVAVFVNTGRICVASSLHDFTTDPFDPQAQCELQEYRLRAGA